MINYQIKEVVGLHTFYIQAESVTQEEKHYKNKVMEFFFGCERKSTWINLNKVGTFNNLYYAQEFKSLEEAQATLAELKEKGAFKYYEQ
jgi:hypothetical protein